MKQAIGALLVLLGALMWHIASTDLPHHNIQQIWADMYKTATGGLGGK